MSLNQQKEEMLASAAQEQRSNCITFNGFIVSDECTDIGGGYIAFNILVGQEKEEFPLCIIESSKEEFDNKIKLNDYVAGYGKLKNIQNMFVVETEQLVRIPNDKEIEKLK